MQVRAGFSTHPHAELHSRLCWRCTEGHRMSLRRLMTRPCFIERSVWLWWLEHMAIPSHLLPVSFVSISYFCEPHPSSGSWNHPVCGFPNTHNQSALLGPFRDGRYPSLGIWVTTPWGPSSRLLGFDNLCLSPPIPSHP